jgi:uncharacterized protein (DUF1800 family)
MATGSRRAVGGILSLALTAPGLGAAEAARPAADVPIVHALNRLTYGPRPGDVAAVRTVGLDKWIDQQLHPERIPDREVQARTAALRTAGLSTHDLLKGYEIPRAARQEVQRRRAELGDDASEADRRRLRQELVAKYAPQMEGSPRLVVDELQQAKLMRAVYSERQLDEVLVDFWMNHFNVYALKGPERFLLSAYEREAIRPHAWGKFEDLLRATAESPAMLFYLDQWLSADPKAAPVRTRAPRPGRPKAPAGRRRGLNENYAREIMELHTLGVEGGYTQNDITEVARCFTGWTIKGLRQQEPEFHFESRLHDSGSKLVLGHLIKGGGQDEGNAVIHLLATHPATARFISLKLARRFVSDEPPEALVERAALVFRKSDGDIREVVRTIVTSPEFFAAQSRGAKVKTPFEFVVSAVRASGARVADARELARRTAAMGMPLYEQQPPTGYKDTAEAWVSASGLLSRLNFALDLAGGRLAGVPVADLAPLRGSAEEMAARLVPAGLSDTTRRTLGAEAGGDPARLAGLILGSPEFQRK